MKCIIFSIGEPTTELCHEALKRQGIEAEVWQDSSSFQDKFKRLCEIEEDVLRVDADIIVNDNLPRFISLVKEAKKYWQQPKGWLWWNQKIEPISVNYFPLSVIKVFKNHLNDEGFKNYRPERYMWGLEELADKVVHCDQVVGIKGYGIKDLAKTKQTKFNRGQVYDWNWIERINNV